MNQQEGEYQAAQRETLAEAPGLRVRLLTLAVGQYVPWHFHNHITDTLVCLRGPMRVETREPEAIHVLEAGDMLPVSAGTPHFVTGEGEGGCKFMAIQGVGEYDYIPLGD